MVSLKYELQSTGVQRPTLTSFSQLPFVDTQVLSSTVLLEDLHFISEVHQIMGQVNTLPKVHHAY